MQVVRFSGGGAASHHLPATIILAFPGEDRRTITDGLTPFPRRSLSRHEHLGSESQYFELEVGFEPTTCGLRNCGDPSFVVNLNWIELLFEASGIQR